MIKKYSDYRISNVVSLLMRMATITGIVFASLIFVNTTAYAEAKTPKSILVLGDSLSGAYGLDTDQGWVMLLQQNLSRQDYDYRVVNASVSGDTTRTGLGRIQSALKMHSPSITIIALGGNDGLRGLPFTEVENSLAEIIERCKTYGSQVLLIGVRLPPNYGPVYNRKFAEIYQRLSDRYQVPLVAKMLDDVADNGEFMQADGIHPTAAAQPLVMQNVWAGLEPLL
jgi:acyl-CoA thioesterase-1